MSENKHIPDRWRWKLVEVFSEKPVATIADSGKCNWTSVQVYGGPRERAEATARLLQASPTMHAALQRVARLNPDAGEIGEGMLRTIVEEARAAIADVEGEK